MGFGSNDCLLLAADDLGTCDGETLAWLGGMARLPRRMLVERGSTNHCTWRAHNFAFVLLTAEAKAFFLELLAEYKDRYGIDINSYTVMDSHPHVQCRCRLHQKAFSAFWRSVNQRFARWSNIRTGRRGQVIMDRMKSARIQDGRYQLATMRYGDMNPVRAGIVRSPKDYPWSSYRHYAFGEPNPLITDAPEYLALGRTATERRRAYVHLFAQRLPAQTIDAGVDLVRAPFVGEREWVAARLAARATSPPS
jgi:putative transposase